MKPFKNIAKIITSHLLLLAILGSTLYNSSLVVMEPQEAAFKLCKNRLALVLDVNVNSNETSNTRTPIAPKEKSQLSSSCIDLFFPTVFLEQPKSNWPKTFAARAILSNTLSGFTEKFLQPPRF